MEISRFVRAFLLALLATDIRATSYAVLIPVKAKGSGPLYRIQAGEKWGYMNRSGAVVIDPAFDDSDDFFEGLAAVRKDGKWGYIRESGEFAIAPRFDSAGSFDRGRAVVTVGERVGVLAPSGSFIVEPQFDEIGPFAGGLAAVWQGAKRKGKEIVWMYGGKWGFIDFSGKMVIQPRFDRVMAFSEGLAAFGVGAVRDKNGNVTLHDGMKWGFIDERGNIVIEAQFDQVVQPFCHGVAVVYKEKGGSGLIDRTGKAVTAPEFSRITSFSEGLAAAWGPAGNGFLAPNGKFAIHSDGWKPSEIYTDFPDGLAPVRAGDGRIGFIDKAGLMRIPPYFEDVQPFSESMAPVKAGVQWGYIDTHGRMVIPPRFDHAMPFVDGLALVRIENIWSYIDPLGDIVKEDVFQN